MRLYFLSLSRNAAKIPQIGSGHLAMKKSFGALESGECRDIRVVCYLIWAASSTWWRLEAGRPSMKSCSKALEELQVHRHKGFTGKQKWQVKKAFSKRLSARLWCCLLWERWLRARFTSSAVKIWQKSHLCPSIHDPTGNSNWKGRKRPVGCHLRSMWLFAGFHQAAVLIRQVEKVREIL